MLTSRRNQPIKVSGWMDLCFTRLNEEWQEDRGGASRHLLGCTTIGLLGAIWSGSL
jgi:hypothetical protein